MYILGKDVIMASKLVRPSDEDLVRFPEGTTSPLEKIIHNLKVLFLDTAFVTSEPVYEIEVTGFKNWVRKAHHYVSDEMSETEVSEAIIRQLYMDGFDLKCFEKNIEVRKKCFIFTRKVKRVVPFVSIIPVEEQRRDWKNCVFPPELL